MSFGEKTSITELAITGTLANYLRSFDPLYLQIIWKSIWISALATALCLVVAYPIAFGICFAPERWKPLLLLLVILPFWINLLIRTYALIAVFRSAGLCQSRLEWLWNTSGLAWATGSVLPFEMLYNNGAVIFGLVYVYMPFMVLPLYATIERLDQAPISRRASISAPRSSRTFLQRDRAAHHARHHFRHHPGLHSLPRLVPDTRPAGRRQCHHDRQCHRASVQGRQ